MKETLSDTSAEADLLGPSSTVSFKTSVGIKSQANLVRLNPHSVSFELLGPETLLRLSERLTAFEIFVNTRRLYTGEAVVSSIVNTGSATACEANLVSPLPGLGSFHLDGNPSAAFNRFLRRWQRVYRIHDDYKVVIADLQTFLSSLRLWVEQVELTFQSVPAGQRAALELETAQALRREVGESLGNIFEGFETIADRIEPEFRPAHRAFGQRQLHSHLLCSPFIHRTFVKPLGYAGDYEMMNMINRDPLEGSSLYAKLINAYLLDQVGPQAVRNRVGYLFSQIAAETCRTARLGRPAVIYNIACGPAREVQNFLAQHPLANQAEFHLLDFNEETLQYAGTKLEDVRRTHHLQTPIHLVRKSVHQMLKNSSRQPPLEEQYDLIYCSGLYDYLNDRVIKALNNYLYDQLRPGGLLTVGNFAPNTPVRNFIEHFLEWFLLFRDPKCLAALAPEQAAREDCRVVAEPTGTNLFLEVRKPL